MFHLCLLHGAGIAVLEEETLILVLQFVVDILLSVFFQELHLVEVVDPITCINWNFRTANVINNPYSIPIGLSPICYEFSKV